jgi:hypothetical protein
MEFFYMYLFGATGVAVFFLVLALPDEHHKEVVKELKKSNTKIIKRSKERVIRVKTKTRQIMKSERIK